MSGMPGMMGGPVMSQDGPMGPNGHMMGPNGPMGPQMRGQMSPHMIMQMQQQQMQNRPPPPEYGKMMGNQGQNMPFMMGNMGPGGPNMRFPANMGGPRMGGPRSQGFQQIPPSGPMMRHQQGQMGGGPGPINSSTGVVGGPNDQMRMRFPGNGGPMGPGGPGMIGGP